MEGAIFPNKRQVTQSAFNGLMAVEAARKSSINNDCEKVICLGGKKLFFRKMTEEEKKSTEKATKVGFVFYMIALSVSSAYSFFIESGFNISFLILMVGLIVFFTSDFIFNKITG
ncbi:hypothetical protein [Bacillus haynesii]|uniref:Uncharacterized protein n=1 Tax=Bacillus haynesii TaxID=1925021 RepID=A0AA90ESK3_9BACI|nr:hypothetical protein [Bacillus haynesii]MCY7792356.1 hypothetical protein [Bacillus haynesii]MCY8381815.1 hypothetical protein [Bacillus haynesii]MCY8589572.1 hypothetical protein [Bacillus haynesii]MCY9226865.1 hypothetical protein [Bacillus haynesii]MCY9278999.1 hypothetical protein [Bacillus haynesii]